MNIKTHRHNVRTLFLRKVYSIDIRERISQPIGVYSADQLFLDIFNRYETRVAPRHNEEPAKRHDYGSSDATSYFLHAIITYRAGKRVCVVDGQRRLVGLLLILSALFRLSASLQIEPKLTRQLSSLIYKSGRNGEKRYRITSDTLLDIQRATLDRSLKREMARCLATPGQFTGFMKYLLSRVTIINMEIAPSAVPMVFAGCNTRQEPYAQHELLRSELLAMLAPPDAMSLSAEWKRIFKDIRDPDQFLRMYLCATIARTRVDRVIFDGQYCEPLLRHEGPGGLELGDESPFEIKRFILRLQCYAALYARLPHVIEGRKFGFLNEGVDCRSSCDGCLTVWECFTLLVLATYRLQDPDEQMRIESVARGFDRVYATLIENRAYSINDFERYIFDLMQTLRDCLADQIEFVMTANLKGNLRKKTLT